MKMKKKPILISLLSLVLCMAMVFGFMYRSPLVAFAISIPEDNQYVFDNGDKIQVVSWYDADPKVYSQRHKFENPEKPGTYLWWDETTLTYNESTGKWKADSPMRWQNVDKDGNPDPYHCFLAYYPASLASPDSVLTAIPVTLTGDMSEDDYMFARWFGQRPKNDNVIDLGFVHLMAKFDINLDFGSQYKNVTDVVVKAELAQSGILDLIKFEVEPVSGTTKWQTFTTQDARDGFDWSGTTIAVPQGGYNQKFVISFMADGEQKELTYTHTKFMSISDKVRTTLNLSVGEDVVEIGEVIVSGWANGGNITGGEAEECMHVTYDANNLCTVCGKKKEDGQ